MTDYISREVAIAAFENVDADVCEQYPDGYCDWGFGRAAIEFTLKNVPAADVEPVQHVRRKEWGEYQYYGECMLCPPDANGFCSYGQRRDQSADVRNMGQVAGGGKTDGGGGDES